MNLSKLTKANLISQLEKRRLPTNGLKDDLVRRLKEAIEKESISENENQEENYDSEDENADELENEEKAISNQGSDSSDRLNETLNDDENVKEVNTTEIGSTILTVEDAINMKSTSDVENYSMIVNINDDDNSMPNSVNDPNDPTCGSRDIDNGEHEVIEISEEVIIDDDDNQENDNNYNEEQLHNDQTQEDKSEVEIGKSREEDIASVKVKITLWIHNIAEDVKAIELKELFGKYGKVLSAKVVMNGKDATGNCFGCVELCNNEDAESCITNLDKTEFRGNIITISRNICDLAPKETIQRNISPISSTDSWGGDGKNKEKTKSLSPFVCEPSNQDNKQEDEEENDEKYKTPYRGRGGYRGNNFGGRGGYGSKNDGFDTRGRQQDYRRGNENRGYGSKPERYGDDSARRSFRSNNDDYDTRSRESFQRRDTRGGRDDYGGSKGGDSRYPPMSRDKYSSRENYNNRPSHTKYDDSGRYGNYEHHSSYDDRRDKRPYHDRVRESDYGSSRRDSDIPFKRPRVDHDDYYVSKARHRESDYTSDRSGLGAPRDRYRAPSPKRSFYYSDKDSYRPRSDSHDRRDVNYIPSSGDRRTDPYSSRKSTIDYGHGSFSPVASDRSRPLQPSSRSHKDSYPTDFGGRSRNYDR